MHGSDAFGGFCVYAGFIYLIGATNWCIVGAARGRKLLGFLAGIMYMFVPTSVYLFYGEGNLPRSLIMTIFPLFIMFVSFYLENENRKSLIGVALTFFGMVMCHVGFAGMVAIAFLMYVINYIIITYFGDRKELKHALAKCLSLIAAVLVGFLITGLFLVPALRGGLASNNGSTSQVAILFFQPLLKTLNPVGKYREGYAYYYFGIALFLTALLGVLGSENKAEDRVCDCIYYLYFDS